MSVPPKESTGGRPLIAEKPLSASVAIRLDQDTYQKLIRIADRKDTNVSALLRGTIKQLMKPRVL